MKMKNVLSAREKRLFQTATKNQLIFERLTTRNGMELMRKLLSIRNDYFPKEPQSLDALPKHGIQSICRSHQKLISAIWRIIDSWDDKKRSNFLKEIDSIIAEHRLGKEWIDFFIIYIAARVPCLPIYNLYFDRKIRSNTHLALELNPDTSIENLKDAMPEIKALIKSRWPKYRGDYLTKNSFTKLHDALKIQREKEANPKNRRANSYEEIAKKQMGQKADKAILAHRRGLKEEGKQKGRSRDTSPIRKK